MKTNSELETAVMDELRREPAVTSGDILVDARDGTVTLSGNVPHYAQVLAAERAAQRVEGVCAISEEIDVYLTGVHHRQDSELAEAVSHSLRWHVWVPGNVHADVDHGWVTLAGKATWGFERSAAEDAVRFLSGVKGISNNITLKPNVEPIEAKEAIDVALKRHAQIDAQNIRVSASDGKVILAGTVGSWDQKQEAGAAAWNAPGVVQVANNLTVAY